MDTLIIKPKNKKDLKIITDIAKRFNADVRRTESPYNPEFVDKVLEADQQIKEGKFTAIKTEDLWK